MQYTVIRFATETIHERTMMTRNSEAMRKWYKAGYKLHGWAIPDWNHLATQEQTRKLFALLSELKISADEGKERAKKHFRVLSFTHLSVSQLKWLIEKLEIQLQQKLKNKKE